jgi:hypothetical protein
MKTAADMVLLIVVPPKKHGPSTRLADRTLVRHDKGPKRLRFAGDEDMPMTTGLFCRGQGWDVIGRQ